MLPLDLILLVCDYIPKYEMIDWIERLITSTCTCENKCFTEDLSRNCNALDYYAEKLPMFLSHMYDNNGIAPYIIINKRLQPPFLNVFEIKEVQQEILWEPCRIDNSKDLLWKILCRNPGMIELLSENLDVVDIKEFNKNPAAKEILERHPDKIDWLIASTRADMIEWLMTNPHLISWEGLIYNSASAPLWQAHPEKLQELSEYGWWKLSECGPLEIVTQNLDHASWHHIMYRTDAVPLLLAHPDEIIWYHLGSHHMDAIPILEQIIATQTDEYTVEKYSLLLATFRYSNSIDKVLNAIENIPTNVHQLQQLGFFVGDCNVTLLENPHIINLCKNERIHNFVVNQISRFKCSEHCYIARNPAIFRRVLNQKMVGVLIRIL